jgi:hypothetical protein
MRPVMALVLTGLVLASCAPKPPVIPEGSLDMHELMVHVIDPAATAFWHGAGYRMTEQGEVDLGPKTAEEWKAVEDGAATVAEAGKLLLLSNRARPPEDQWAKFANDMSTIALEGKTAAEARNKEGVFTVGSRLYDACVACHESYEVARTSSSGPRR